MIGATGPGPGGQAAPRPTVQTVRGPVPVTELGRVFMHEHVFVLNEEIRQNYVTDWDEEQQVAAAAAKLSSLRGRLSGRPSGYRSSRRAIRRLATASPARPITAR